MDNINNQQSNPSKSTPRDVFLHLLAIVLLYIGIFSLIALLWKYVDVMLPDQLRVYYGYSQASAVMKNSIAALLVVWPVFIFVNWLIKKNENKEEAKRELKVKKWLLNLTLFIAALTMIIDLIMLINNFLDGSLTLNFFLKVLVVLVVAGLVFGYYLWDLKQDISKKLPLAKIFAWVTSGLILLAIIAGFFIMGTPQEQRNKRFDEQRVQNLQVLQSEIINYWQVKGILPRDLQALANNVTGFTAPVDPASKEPYEYEIKDELNFSLCANFASASGDTKVTTPRFDYYGYEANWDHGAGRVCFDRTIDPDYYKKTINDKTLEPPVEVIR